MTLAEAVVVVLGIALIAGELWYFLGPRSSDAATSTRDDGVQEIPVLVKGGYHPDVIPVEARRPVRLLFYRDETADCSARIVFEQLGIDLELPAFRTTPIEFTPDDRAIDGEDLPSDIEVPLTLEGFAAGRDPQLDRAIEYLRSGQ